METVLKLSTEVTFTRPITGSEVDQIVKLLVDDANARKRGTFRAIKTIDPNDPDRFLIGQASDYNGHSFLVIDPDSDVDSLLAYATYKKLLIRRNHWLSTTQTTSENEPAKDLAELLDFTNRFVHIADARHGQFARL